MKRFSGPIALLLLSGCLLACGDDSSDADAGGDGDGDGAQVLPLEYTGDFTMGETIPPKHKCLASAVGTGTGDNLSPELRWRGGPAETQSFAVVLFDARWGQFHWAIWDIPADATGLPEGIAAGFDVADPQGAHQMEGISGKPEYFGPCSDAGALAGTYEYRLHALDTASLEFTDESAPQDVLAAIEAASLEVAVWSGTPE